MDISKQDWKLLREKIGNWQETYMEKLSEEYITILSDESKPASERFWELDKRIRNDKQSPGVMVRWTRNNAIPIIMGLIRDGVIEPEELQDFSDELKETVAYFLQA